MPRFGITLYVAAVFLAAALTPTDAACPFSGQTGGGCQKSNSPHSRRAQSQSDIEAITTAWLAGNDVPGGAVEGAYENVVDGSGNNVPQYPFNVMTCASPIPTTTSFDESTYDTIAALVVTEMQKLSSTCTEKICPRADFVGCVVRFAGHDLMDYRDVNGVQSGGSDGCISFSDADNRGLGRCLAADDVSLDNVYSQVCSQISLADFTVLAAEALMVQQSTTPATTREMFKSAFMWGRTTSEACSENDATSLMPNPENGCPGLENIFSEHVYARHDGTVDAVRSQWCEGGECTGTASSGEYAGNEDAAFAFDGMDRKWYLTAAISGAHTLGRALPGNSGYFGWWSDHLQSSIFNNDYYKSMIFKGWRPDTGLFGNAAKNQWIRADVLGDTADLEAHSEMMLDTDMCLAYTHNTNDLHSSSANGCCAWIEGSVASAGLFDTTVIQDMCGSPLNANQNRGRGTCCNNNENPTPANQQSGINQDCDLTGGGGGGANGRPRGPAYATIDKFAKNELAFLYGFSEAWWWATTNGFDGSLSFLRGQAVTPSSGFLCANAADQGTCEANACLWSPSNACVAGTLMPWGTLWGEVDALKTGPAPTPPPSPSPASPSPPTTPTPGAPPPSPPAVPPPPDCSCY